MNTERYLRYSLLPLLWLGTLGISDSFAAEIAQPPSAKSASLTNAFARIVKNAIPHEYEKRKDWGKTKHVTVGLRTDGLKIHRRKKPVKHGVWKHYKARLIDPEETLSVQIEDVRPGEAGRLKFTIVVQAKLDLWARAKVYQYGVHLIALETLGDAAIKLSLDCEIGMRLKTQSGSAGFAIDPTVTDARLDIVDFHLRRVSNAKGPIVRELGEEIPGWIKDELRGPKFVAKLNRAIDKKRDRFELRFEDLLSSSK